MKTFILLLIFTGNPANGTYIPFEDMAACQDAKTVIMADASYQVAKAYCFPTKR